MITAWLACKQKFSGFPQYLMIIRFRPMVCFITSGDLSFQQCNLVNKHALSLFGSALAINYDNEESQKMFSIEEGTSKTNCAAGVYKPAITPTYLAQITELLPP